MHSLYHSDFLMPIKDNVTKQLQALRYGQEYNDVCMSGQSIIENLHIVEEKSYFP